MLGNTEGKKEKRAAGDEMVREHHQLNGHDPEQTPGDSGRQRGVGCCSPRGHRVRLDLATEQQAAAWL